MNNTATLPDDGSITLNNRQRLFIRYFTAILVDLVVLNLFDEYWDKVVINSFTISLFAAVVLQLLLQLTLVFEHRMASYFKSKSGKAFVALRWLSTWLVLFISKFIILWVLDISFGDEVLFLGVLHGLVAFIVVVFAILLAEKAIMKLYQSLA
ncbi:MAG: hypothetical protein OQL16_09735 [Gammaproteobacteria bacterium]|nr:hypothetical protein [Gammaproteobacteria bacterium]